MTPGCGAESIREARAIVEAIDLEQDVIAQELHDTVCQSLSGARLSAAAIRRRLASSEVAIDCNGLEESIDRSVHDLQGLVQSLQRVEIQPSGLAEALEALVIGVKGGRFCKSCGCSVNDSFVASQVFRIAREVVLRATRKGCGVTLSWLVEEQSCVLRVAADVPVFADNEPRPPLMTLLRRARAICGELQVDSAGSVITLTLPSEPECATG